MKRKHLPVAEGLVHAELQTKRPTEILFLKDNGLGTPRLRYVVVKVVVIVVCASEV